MKVLLLGEYSNVHATLARGLRAMGHEVVVASNGDFWKNYPRDIDLAREPGKLGGLKLMATLWHHRQQLKGYDVVQLINPMFVELKAERCQWLYRWLRRHNGKVFLGAFGMDFYWVNENRTRMPLRYSDFNMGRELRDTPETRREVADWIGTAKGRLNQQIAADCDGIIAGLYEYWAVYAPLFPAKTRYIPFPIEAKKQEGDPSKANTANHRLSIFIGISRGRSRYKGTDIMLRAAKTIAEKYPESVNLRVAEGLPFEQYVREMHSADVILDQLYSYTPAMNGLEAMSRGIVCVGGGEPEHYDLLGERDLRPLINVEPCYESVYSELEQLALHPERVTRLKEQSIEYIASHHDHLKVARQYLEFWTNR